MSWWGKILGGIFGYLINGPFTALLGALLGHFVDTLGNNTTQSKPSRRHKNPAFTARSNYFSSTFYVMGHVCKADGHISADEIRVAREVMERMELTKPQCERAIGLFNEGKSPAFPVDQVLKKLRTSCSSQKNLLRMFMEIQIMAAMADGDLSVVEHRLLLQISERLGIPRQEYQHIERRVRIAMGISDKADHQEYSNGENKLREAYIFLGIKEKASDRDVKKAYRRLLSQHHPDKLVSKGLPEEMMKLATQKTHEIRQAYEVICTARDG